MGGYNLSTPDQAPPTSLPQNLYPTVDQGNPSATNYPQSSGTSYTGYSSTAPGGPPAGGPFGYMTLASTATEEINTARQAEQAAQGLSAAGAKNLSGYENFLNAATSEDPKTRMAVASAPIGDEIRQQNAARGAISTLPRGGAQDFLAGESYIQQASDIGTLLNQVWNQAETAKGQLGITETNMGAQQLELAQSGYSIGGSMQGGALNIKNSLAAANQAAITKDIGTIASLAVGL